MTREEFMIHATEEADKIRGTMLKWVAKAWIEDVRSESARAGQIVKVAHWVPEPGRNSYRCSACGNVWSIAAMAMHYCPDCGAEMEMNYEQNCDTNVSTND